MAKAIINAEEVRLHFDYNPETGVFTRKRKTGKPNGWYQRGYLILSINHRHYVAHRLAWAYVHGRWPTFFIDHINGNPADNRICNLREVTNAENGQNQRKPRSDNTTGYLGVSFCKRTGRYMAKITINQKQIYLGRYDTPEEAYVVYVFQKRALHPMGTL